MIISIRTLIVRYTLTLALIVLMLFSSSSSLAGQDEKDQAPPFRERIFFGGNFGLMFGTITDIQVSPVVGYWLLPRVAAAVGPSYRYYKDRINSTAIYGGKAYLQFVVIQDINSVIPIGVHTGIFLHENLG